MNISLHSQRSKDHWACQYMQRSKRQSYIISQLGWRWRCGAISTRSRWRCSTSRRLNGCYSVDVNFFTRKFKESKIVTEDFSFSCLFWGRINKTMGWAGSISLLATDVHGPVKKIGVFRVQVVGKHCTKFTLWERFSAFCWLRLYSKEVLSSLNKMQLTPYLSLTALSSSTVHSNSNCYSNNSLKQERRAF